MTECSGERKLMDQNLLNVDSNDANISQLRVGYWKEVQNPSCLEGMAFDDLPDLDKLMGEHSDIIELVRQNVHAKDPSLLKSMHDDVWLLRFVMHTTVEKATDRLLSMLQWRKENDVDRIAEHVVQLKDFTKFPHYDKVNTFLPTQVISGFTIHGSPFQVEKWGSARPKEMLEDVRLDEWMEFAVYKFEYMRLKLDQVLFMSSIGILKSEFVLSDYQGHTKVPSVVLRCGRGWDMSCPRPQAIP